MRLLCFALLLLSLSVTAAPADEPPPPPTPACEGDPAFAMLDFWLGDWDVFVDDQKVGHNHIAKILNGCAITEDWTAASGAQGHSLFYYLPAEQSWKQVWVTGTALARGGVKEKTMTERMENAVRFQGEIKLPGGGGYLDRTTLTSLDDGDVRQLIEVSTDGGGVWLAVFDARYVRTH